MSPYGVRPFALAVSLLVAPAAAPAEQDPPPVALGAVRVRAESCEQRSKGHVEARGLVDLSVADVRIQADKADVTEELQPDGSTRQRVVAEGNVALIRGEERLSGDRLEMDDSGKGTLLNAVGYLEPGVFVTARKIERLDADSYRVLGGTFSSCAQPNPRWSFSASRARVDVDDKITGANAVFKVKGVPAFYTPYVYYPVRRDRRSTGFLLPSIGYSAARGYNLKAGFFWAMGRSADQTFWLDYYSQAGYGLWHELRWVGSATARWTARSLLFDANGPGGPEYALDGGGLQLLPGKVRAAASMRLASSTAFAQQYGGDSARGARANDWSLSLDRDFGPAVLSVYGQSTSARSDGHVDARLPGLSLRHLPRPIWGGLVLGLTGSAERIRYGPPGERDAWTRYDFAPTLSRPLRVSFLEIDPSLGYRYTRYGSSVLLDEQGAPRRHESGELDRDGPPLARSRLETSIEVRGPTFARVFDTPGASYSDRFKHTIGPEITWTTSTPLADSLGIPPSGQGDRRAGTSRIDYALVQRFYAKRRGPSGRAMPYEFLSWRVAQRYDMQPGEAYAGQPAAGRSERLGPIQSRLTLRPAPDLRVDSVLEYDVGQRRVRRTSVSLSAGRPGFSLEAGWTRTLNGADEPTRRDAASQARRGRDETLAGNAVLELLPGRLGFEGGLDYDVAGRQLWQLRGLVRYSSQCCGFTIEHNWRRNDAGPPDAQWRFSFELANIGSIGAGAPARRDGGLF